MNLYIENPEETIKKHIIVNMNEFSKVRVYKTICKTINF